MNYITSAQNPIIKEVKSLKQKNTVKKRNCFLLKE